MTERRAGAGGFTLIEVLIALTVMAILMAGLFGVLRFGAQSWDTGARRATQVEDLQITHGFLRRRLTAMQFANRDPDAQAPLGGRSAIVEDIGAVGGPRRLRFVSTLPAEIGMGGLYLFDLHLAEDGSGDLLLDWYVHRPEGVYPPNDPAERRRVLLTGIADLEFAYLVPSEDGGPVWQSEWRPEFGLPAAVRIDVAFPPGDPRIWPGFVAIPTAALK